jgi:hypothetical protein
MKLRTLIVGVAGLVFSLSSLAMSANFKIDNPADTIDNPVDKMYNPATRINNPAANIYNPADRMDNPNPLSPPTQPVPQQAAAKGSSSAITASEKTSQTNRTIPHKSYTFKGVRTYIVAAKNAFTRDDYVEFIAITEDALRRINAGTLKASNKSKQTLLKYKKFGYGLLENDEE